MFLTFFSPFSEVGNDSETYGDKVSDEDDEDDAGENQQNNDLPLNEGVISSQIPVQQRAEDAAVIVESSRGRKRELPGQAHSSNVCTDEGCEASIDDENELLRCDAPGCHLTVSVLRGFGRLLIMSPQYHLSCQGLVDKPVGGWFCDDECKKNAGYRVGGGRKRRRRA